MMIINRGTGNAILSTLVDALSWDLQGLHNYNYNYLNYCEWRLFVSMIICIYNISSKELQSCKISSD